MEKRVWDIKGPQGKGVAPPRKNSWREVQPQLHCRSTAASYLPSPSLILPKGPTSKDQGHHQWFAMRGKIGFPAFPSETQNTLNTKNTVIWVVTFYSRAVQRSFLQWHRCPVATLSNRAAISQTQLVWYWNTANASEEVNILPNFNSHIRLLAIVWKSVVNIQHMEAKYLNGPTLKMSISVTWAITSSTKTPIYELAENKYRLSKNQKDILNFKCLCVF